MCGFFGVATKFEVEYSLAKKSDEFLFCRGPDEHKISEVNYENLKIYNSFHRLSIVDLSKFASQPMKSEENNTEIMFNGEIFNHLELRRELSHQYSFKSSHSDTETLLAGLSIYGPKFINKVDGQFSIIFLDYNKNTLTLIRDRLGQKPLFYCLQNDCVLYSSNFKSILNYKNKFTLDEDQIPVFLELGVVPSPNTLDKNIKKIEPGEIIEISLKDFSIIQKEKYWDISNFIDNQKFSEKKFFNLFKASVNKRLLSDVPLAFLLSGGIDSTSIIKMMFHSNLKPINTFTVNNKNLKYDESNWSNKVVEKYNTKHQSIEIDGSNLSINPLYIIDKFDEPYADPSIIPSFMVYKEISKKYKVAISGDGGDELLAGYEKIIFSLKKGIIPTSIYKIIFYLLPSRLGSGGSLAKISKSPELSYISLTVDKKLLKLLKIKTKFDFKNLYLNNEFSQLKKLLYADYKFYLSELMLLKVDRSSMANSLEVRSPYLDHKLVEYIFSTDLNFIDFNNSKSILKKYLNQDFDKSFTDRKKMGFVFDLEIWIFENKPLLLNIISKSKLFNIKKVKKLFLFKKKINAIRIFKLVILCEFIESYNSFNSK